MSSNAVEILPGMWLGNSKSAVDQVFLNDKQIQCVINCTQNCPFTDDTIVELKYRIPVKDNLVKSEISNLYQCLDVITHKIWDNCHKYNILVHCHQGRQRSPAVIVAYLMKYVNMDLNDATKAVKTKKINVFEPYFNFEPALKQYENDLHFM